MHVECISSELTHTLGLRGSSAWWWRSCWLCLGFYQFHAQRWWWTCGYLQGQQTKMVVVPALESIIFNPLAGVKECGVIENNISVCTFYFRRLGGFIVAKSPLPSSCFIHLVLQAAVHHATLQIVKEIIKLLLKPVQKCKSTVCLLWFDLPVYWQQRQ